MAGTEELLARLQQLEDGYYGDKQAAREKAFFDQFGGRFSNDRGLGLAILNELDARGIDTSAADEAVTQILDQLRTECSAIVDLIKDVQDAAVETEKKVDTIQEVVQSHVSDNPDASVSSEPGDIGSEEFNPDEMSGMPSEGSEPVPDEMGGMPSEGSEPAPDMGGMPPEGGAPAPDMGGEPAPDMGGMPPEGAPAEEPLPPNQIPSDERIKNIRAAYGRIKERRTQSRSSFKPSAGIIAAAQGGN